MCRFFNQICKNEINKLDQLRKLPKILKSVNIIHYYSLLFIRVLSRELHFSCVSRGPAERARAGVRQQAEVEQRPVADVDVLRVSKN